MIRLRPSGVDEILIKRVQDWYEPGPGVFITSTSTLFSPAQLFTGSTTGVWYDPSDTTTLYRDAAGTLPVTAVEQPVGLMLDKSKGLVLGPELVTNAADRDFTNDTGWWSKAGVTIGSGFCTFSSTGTYGGCYRSGLAVAGKWYEATIKIASISSGAIAFNAGGSWDSVGKTSPGTYTFRVLAGSNTNIGIVNIGITTATIDSISVRELPGNHAFNPSGNSANFPVLKEDATGRKYLSFNGTNQWLQTNSIDFTYGDKMFVSAGVRKLSDAAQGVIAELSTSAGANLSAILLDGPNTAATNYRFASRGSILSSAIATDYSAPITNVLSGIGNISGDQSILRINGEQAAISTADQGTGNYGNYPLYIGARAGSSLWFNGRLYQMVVAGKQASAAEITNTETFVNQKTGAY